MKIIHIILNLGYGGAENMLVKLVNQDTENEILIITLTDYCPLIGNIKNKNVTVISGFKSGPLNHVLSFIKIIKLLSEFKPSIIQAWMYHSELMGLIIKLFYPKAKLFWNIRCSTSEWINLRLRNRAIFKVLKMGSGLVSGIIVNSRIELLASIDLGYPKEKLIYIPNGFEFIEERDKLKYREILLNKFNIEIDAILIGMVTRNHVLKDLDTMLMAFQLIKKRTNGIHLILVGAGFDSQFEKKVEQYNIDKFVHYYGTTNNVFDVLFGFDIAVLSSRTESFPNVIAEYMLASLPIVSTDVAEIPEIVGDSGIVVPSGNPEALCDAIVSVINMSHEDKVLMGKKARQRILENYPIDKIYNSYLDYYQKALL
jgi:glycosyltransferase involved in cell wall biosynthesis